MYVRTYTCDVRTYIRTYCHNELTESHSMEGLQGSFQIGISFTHAFLAPTMCCTRTLCSIVKVFCLFASHRSALGDLRARIQSFKKYTEERKRRKELEPGSPSQTASNEDETKRSSETTGVSEPGSDHVDDDELEDVSTSPAGQKAI